MKMRTINHVTAAITVLANLLVLIAVLTGMHTLFGIIAASISLAVSMGMYLRVAVGTAALKVEERREKLVCFAIAQRNEPEVVQEFAKWVRDDDRDFRGAIIVELLRAKDENGDCVGYWLTLIGTESVYRGIKKELTNSTVLDYWPIDRDEYANDILKLYLGDEEIDDFDEDEPIEELKG